MKRRIPLLSVALMAIMAFPAWALDLHEARRNGQIGERLDGYVEALSQSPGVVALVSDVNAKRRQEYARIAQTKGQTADIVAGLAAQEIIGGLPPGSMYQAPGGGWKKR